MYLLLVKYFYYFYFLKKNKKFKFFILIDLIFFLMKKYYSLLKLKKKIIKYKNFFFRSKSKHFSHYKYLLYKTEYLLERRINAFNVFIVNFLPTQLLPLGNRKKFYNLLNKKFKRFFLVIKKKLNKKFFFYFMIKLFNKIKFLFLKSDPFLNKKDFIFNFFTSIVFESKYTTLLRAYNAVNKKIKKNIILQFYDILYFFSFRIDYFIFKLFPFFSLSEVRNGIVENKVLHLKNEIRNINYFIKKYDLLKSSIFNNIYYIFSLRRYFYNSSAKLKKKYYLVLCNYRKEQSTFFLCKGKKKTSLFSSHARYLSTIDEIHTYFYKLKDQNYNFDSLNQYISNFKIQKEFPFFLKEKKKDLDITFLNSIGNIYLSYGKKVSINNYTVVNLINFLYLFFYLSKYNSIYYYTKESKLIVSPSVLNNLLNEYKKLFFYFTIFFSFNIVTLM
ncbi:ribosomal protein S4 (mitochondrion) [Naegleria fowleri]|uniref:Ribosomal protein S4 n=1 Tax=Naegleria fowleri TaxID=5763 RepID=M4H5K4_NAEFO|nr:ribosomal protein S4 [Naegleria fowleri]AFP72335.1 ribosomal protein S4 [Naegleria fowleri]AOS85613.1 ribosomal protein S4 [Naegleria fowleri]AOS85659.1 ribosomal protein S4 [Naegleria fowleri]UAT97103.1 ribosomal protein S4 [Naegleria fowleri]WND64473.1 hypothetical protein HHPHBPLO_00061 [Naegleria fowleri]